MKKKLKTIGHALCLTAGIAAVGLFYACSEEVQNLLTGNGTEVQVNVSFADADETMTRAADGLNSTSGFSLLTSTNSSSKVRVMVDQNDGSYTQFDYNITAATTLGIATAPTFNSGVSSVNVYGWYPNVSLTDFSVAADQTGNGGYCLSDLMAALGTTCTRNIETGAITSAANLSFTHLMAKVKVSLTLASGVTVKSVKFKNMLPQVDVTPTKTSNAVTAYDVSAAEGTATDITLLTDGSLTSSSAAADKLLCGVFPGQSKNGAFLEITASYNAGADQTITYSFSSAKTFVKGNVYVMNISLDGTNVTTGTVDITDWNTAAGTVNIGSGGGDAPTLSPSSLTLTYGGSTGSITPTFAGATTFSGISSDAGVATVSGTSTLTVTPVAAGTCTIQVFPTDATTGFSSAACTVTVNKAAQTVGLSVTALTVGGVGNTGTFTVTRSGDGTITAESSNPSIATTSVNQGTGVVTVTNVAEGSPTITVTVAEGTNHLAYTAADKTVAVTCNAINMVNNPLWRVAQYNVQSSGNFATSHSTSSPPVWNFTDAQTIGASISGYHQPTMKEQASIFPMDKTTGSGTNVWGLSETLASPKAFSEITCTVNGADVAASTSYIGKNASNDYYAVRFIGTNYASAWHYKWVTSPCAGLLIESYLISSSLTASEAQALLATLASSTIFTGAANAAAANQTPASTTVTTNGFVQRFLPACGYKNGSSGTAGSFVGARGYYWSSTADSSNGFYWYFNSNGYLYEDSNSQSIGSSVRLFRDN